MDSGGYCALVQRSLLGAAVIALALTAGCSSSSEPAATRPPAAPAVDAQSSAADSAEPVAAETSAGQPKTITVENNPDFAALLAGPPHGRTVDAAVEKFQAKTVEFDGFVSDIYLNPREHNGESTIDVMAGDASDKKHTGPVFQLSWYGHEDPMEKLAKGTNVHVKALAGVMYEFEPFQYYLIDEDANDSESPLTVR